MGPLDTERRDSTVDRHDHKTIYEDNIGVRRAANNTQLLVVAILVICLLVLLFFANKIVGNKCLNK